MGFEDQYNEGLYDGQGVSGILKPGGMSGLSIPSGLAGRGKLGDKYKTKIKQVEKIVGKSLTNEVINLLFGR